MPSVLTPVSINGRCYDYYSIQVVVDGFPRGGVKSVEYSHGLEPGEGRGTRAQVTLRSRGKYSSDASMEVYKAEYYTIIQALGPGYMERVFDIVVAYAETGLPVITDTLKACRIKKDSDSGNDDGGVSYVKVDLSVMYMLRNGLVPVEVSKFLL